MRAISGSHFHKNRNDISENCPKTVSPVQSPSENADHSSPFMDRGSFLIAASTSVSAAECMRCFREGIGMPPVQYLKNYRLLMASTYLKATD